MIWDVTIVGAGAAGLMAAITAGRLGAKVLLLDGKEKIGAKILMSGGTRCNLTNKRVSEKDFESEQKRTVRNILRSFTSEQAIRFFNGIGVEVTLEEGGKYFPSTHSGKTVLDALLKEIKTQGVKLENASAVSSIQIESGYFKISGHHFAHLAKSVILTTGGLSYPSTGSNGSGYALAKSFGHTLISTVPALTPLRTDDEDWKTLAGITLPVKLDLIVNGKKQVEYHDSFLFTHIGFSGPSVLNMSRHWIYANEKTREVEVRANFLPSYSLEELKTLISDAVTQYPKRRLDNWLSQSLPERLTMVLIQKAGLDGSVTLSQLTRQSREALIRSVFSVKLEIADAVGYSKAEVTAGGINLEEVDSKTLESKYQPGLFFAGEILDVDGRIGGFNFQWAWSSGYVAANHAARTIKGAIINAS